MGQTGDNGGFGPQTPERENQWEGLGPPTPSAFLNRRARAQRGTLRWAVAWGAMGGLLLIPQAWMLGRVLGDAVIRGRVEAWMLGVLPAIFILRALCAWRGEAVAVRAAVAAKTALRRDLFAAQVARGPLGAAPAGGTAAAVTDGVETLEPFIARTLPGTRLAVIVPLGLLVAVATVDGLSALILGLTAPLIPLFMILIGRGAERLNVAQWDRLTRMGARFLDLVQGLGTLRLFAATGPAAALVEADAEGLRAATMRVLRVAFLSALALEFLATVSIAVVAVLVGFRLLWGEMDLAAGLFVLLLAPEFYAPLRAMGTHYHARMEALGAAERLIPLLAPPPPRPAAQAVPALLPCLAPRVVLRGVTCGHGDGPAVLRGLDLVLEPETMTALVGPSGAGKSTLAALLLRFLEPRGGDILIDGTPLTAWTPQDWRRVVAWVPQEPHLFKGSVRRTLALGYPGASDAALWQAAERAGAAEFLRALPHGLDTLLGERGLGLSGGQARRLALARAFLQDAPLVVLDEPTASLDPASEAVIAEALRTLRRGRTLLVIAHRRATIAAADRVAVLDHGRIVESGSYQTLSTAQGPFAALVRATASPLLRTEARS